MLQSVEGKLIVSVGELFKDQKFSVAFRDLQNI